MAEHGQLLREELPGPLWNRLRDHDERSARRCGRDTVFDWRYREFARARSLVGVLHVPGLTVEVLPKTCAEKGPDGLPRNSQANLLAMLTYVGWLPASVRGMAPLATERMPLLDAFVQAFCARLLEELTRGPDRGYSYREEVLRHVKGRLLVQQQVRRNPALRHRVPVGYDEFDEDTPLNRILKAAARRVLDTRAAGPARGAVTRVMEEFGEVADERITADHFRRVAFHRNNERFRDLFEFARLLLLDRSPAPRAGEEESFSIIFPMERLFEAFFARYVHRNAARLGLRQDRVRVQCRGRTKWLLWRERDDRGAFRLVPDLLVEAHDGFEGAVLDTKWKLPPREVEGEATGPSQADLYQMAAYAHRFGLPDNILVYPALEGARDESFRLEGTRAHVHIRLLDLGHDLRREPGRTLEAVGRLLRTMEGVPA